MPTETIESTLLASVFLTLYWSAPLTLFQFKLTEPEPHAPVVAVKLDGADTEDDELGFDDDLINLILTSLSELGIVISQ